MKNLDLTRATLSAIIVWSLGVAAFVTSYYMPVMDNLDTQANWVLSIALIPATIMGARFYYQNGSSTNGLLLGICMFLVTMVLDACITVPFFIFPAGGNHLSFFADAVFWIIGTEYIIAVAAYGHFQKKERLTDISQA